MNGKVAKRIRRVAQAIGRSETELKRQYHRWPYHRRNHPLWESHSANHRRVIAARRLFVVVDDFG